MRKEYIPHVNYSTYWKKPGAHLSVILKVLEQPWQNIQVKRGEFINREHSSVNWNLMGGVTAPWQDTCHSFSSSRSGCRRFFSPALLPPVSHSRSQGFIFKQTTCTKAPVSALLLEIEGEDPV